MTTCALEISLAPTPAPTPFIPHFDAGFPIGIRKFPSCVAVVVGRGAWVVGSWCRTLRGCWCRTSRRFHRRTHGRSVGGSDGWWSIGEFGCLIGLLVQRMVGVELGVEFSTSTRLVGKELKGLAQVILDQTVLCIVVVLSARADTNVEHVDDHGRLVGVVAVSTKVALIVGTAGAVVGGRTRRGLLDLGRLIAAATRTAELADIGFTGGRVGVLDLCHVDGLENARFAIGLDLVERPLDALDAILGEVAKGTRVDNEAGEKKDGT